MEVSYKEKGGASATASAPTGERLRMYGFGVAIDDRVILASIDLPVRAAAGGGVTALVGPTGTGKSTLLRSLAGLNSRSPNYRWWGNAEYMGQPLSEGHRPPLVLQHAQAANATAIDALSDQLNEHHPEIGDVREYVQQRLRLLGMPDLASALGHPTAKLSPLQRRAITILREALCAPPLLMLDEPTFGLSDFDAFSILDLLRAIAANGTSVFVVLHNQKHIRSIATDIVLLAGGRIQEAATLTQFFNTTNPVARQFIETGSCSVPAPDIDPEYLAEDVEPPPPLPIIAQLSMQAAPESMGPRGFTWIVPGRLAGTPLPGVTFEIDYDLQALRAVGITCLITLTERDLPQDALERNGLKNMHLAIEDRKTPDIDELTALLERMDMLLDSGESLAVHCLAGIGRTGTILACWLIRKGMTAADALRYVRRVEPRFVQTEGQEDFLRQYEGVVRKK
ncbi:MAG: dual specificity protein phosphatase family protein [Gallionellaceae bacterium]|nr:dual specificity protein phosphatase family protein [Gallionellaceae bacterium]